MTSPMNIFSSSLIPYNTSMGFFINISIVTYLDLKTSGLPLIALFIQLFFNLLISWPTLQQFGFLKIFFMNILKMIAHKYVSPKKVAFKLVQKWPHKDEFIGTSNIKLSKKS
jgi:hypothetical protein